MSDRLKSIRPAEQCIRSSFLCHIQPEAAETVRQFAHLLEAALHEAYTDVSDRLPFNVILARATAEDLEALLRHQQDAIESWNREDDADTTLYRSMLQTLDVVREAHETLLAAVGVEEARRGA